MHSCPLCARDQAWGTQPELERSAQLQTAAAAPPLYTSAPISSPPSHAQAPDRSYKQEMNPGRAACSLC